MITLYEDTRLDVALLENSIEASEEKIRALLREDPDLGRSYLMPSGTVLPN